MPSTAAMRGFLYAIAEQTCSNPKCGRDAVSLAYDEKLSMLVPVCRAHILVYRVTVDGKHIWQAEDEFADLLFTRRSRFRWLAQRRILNDQYAAALGKVSRAQRKLREAQKEKNHG